jgi:hypothetical protein
MFLLPLSFKAVLLNWSLSKFHFTFEAGLLVPLLRSVPYAVSSIIFDVPRLVAPLFRDASARQQEPSAAQSLLALRHFRDFTNGSIKKKTPWLESASELYQPSDLRLLAKLVPTFADRECCVVGVTDPFGIFPRISRLEPLPFFPVAPQLYYFSQNLVVRIPGYRSRSLGSIPGVVGLERGPLSLASTTEELLGRENSGSGLESQ